MFENVVKVKKTKWNYPPVIKQNLSFILLKDKISLGLYQNLLKANLLLKKGKSPGNEVD